ncbi:MAG: CBS domain-containing protein [Candidatus Nanopelagicales bacterium]|nr:CBS domain-containing protein [Candidatus Nanopelagicales bacterium]MDZ4249489.1 CBS domain-containing protein [Candidatus Nanopelagicales bacterium]
MSHSSTRVFLARLAGVPAFDPNGDQVGKVRDFVVTVGADGPPHVLGLLTEVPVRRRIFLPISRVRSFAAGQVVVSGLVNLRRFEQRRSETLVMGELLDRRLTLLADGTTVTLTDVAIEQSRTSDWYVTALYVRRGGRFGRRGDSFVVDWDEVSGLGRADPTQGADELLAKIARLRPADVAHMLHELPDARRAQVALALEDSRLADILEELPDDDRVEILSAMDVERAADVLEQMDPDDAADLISDLNPPQATELLGRMEPDDADDIRLLLTYDERTAGGLMTTEPVIVGPDATVADALARIRESDVPPALASQVYVARPPLESPTGRYLGAAHFQALLREPPFSLVSAIVDSELTPISAQTPLSEVTRYFAAYNLVAAPVVDGADHLLGAVTVDDVLDHMLPDDWREVPPPRDADDDTPGPRSGGDVTHGR